jgi:hypothetical protein
MSKMEIELKNKHGLQQEERLIAARKDYEKIAREIAPYIKKRKVKKHSTSGAWKVTK